MYRVHNSTVSRQLRYALTKERLCCMAVTPATYAPYAVAEMGGGGCMRSRGMWGWSSSRIIEKYQAIHTYCAASGATYEYALDIFAALFVRVTASL